MITNPITLIAGVRWAKRKPAHRLSVRRRLLVACEFSGIVRDCFSAIGWEAWSCDLLPSETSGKHIQGNVLDFLDRDWDLIIAHPPCTYLCNSGVRWLYNKDGSKNESRWIKLHSACDFFNRLLNSPCSRICVENPIQHKHASILIHKYSQIVQPWQFGHGETKATCLWLKNLPKLMPTNIVEGRKQRCHFESPGPDRWKNRSRTFLGIAKAMADQWGYLQ